MRRTRTTPLIATALLCAAAALPGCNLSQPYPAKQLYAIDAGAPADATTPDPGSALRVASVQVAQPFTSREFQYRVGPNQFEHDYYANFVAKPGDLLTALLLDWMAATGLYEAVVDSSSTVGATQLLRCSVTDLYGDYTDPAAPRAVIAARFFLIDDSDVDGRVLFTSDYREVASAADGSPDALVEAWGEAMGAILEQLTADLRSRTPVSDDQSGG